MNARWEGLRRVFRLPLGRRLVEGEVREELRFHLEERIEELMEQGLTREAAEREARTRFGDPRLVAAQLERIDRRTVRKRSWREAGWNLGRDLRLSVRGLVRQKGFSVAAILTLGVGLGATGSMYTLIQRVVLDPLPYPSSTRLVRLKNPVPGVEKGDEWNLSTAQYFHYRRQVQEFDAIGLYRHDGVNAAAGGEPSRAQAAVVTASVLKLVGAHAVKGRLFTEADDSPGAPAVAVLSYAFWRGPLGGDPGIVGKSIRLNDEPVPVIGVMAAGIELPRDRGETLPSQVDLWLPIRLNPAGPFYNNHVYPVVARLAPGATLGDAQRHVDQLQRGLPEAFPDAYSAAFFERYGFHTVVYPLKRYVLGDLAQNLWILFGAVGVVLVIACANVVNLLLVRLEARRRELAMRSALGASRGDILREALAGGSVLALAGAAVGMVLSVLNTRWLIRFAPRGLPRLSGVAVDGNVALFLAGLAAVITVALACVPAFQYRGLAATSVLADSGRRSTAGIRRQRFRSTLVATQMALALMLVVGSGLLLQSFRRLRAVDPGIAPQGTLTLSWYLPYRRYDSLGKVWRFHDLVLREIRRIPGVTAAGASQELPFLTGFGCTIQGFEEPAVFERIKQAGLTTCAGQGPTTPGYFEALGMPLVGGRLFTADDNVAPERGAVVVTKAFAERFWPGENPIGKGVNPNGRTKPPFYHVVGVVGDVHGTSLDEPPAMAIFYPIVAMPGGARWYPNEFHLVVRTSRGDPLTLVPAIRRAVNAVDPTIPLANAETMANLVAGSMGRLTFTLTLLGLAGSVALALAAIGLYGVISYVVARRTNEIGVRMALGANPRQVQGLVVSGALRLALVGLLFGIAGAALGARVLSGLLYGVAPWNPLAYAASIVLLLGVAGIAGWIPARRAARVDPVAALREE